MSNGDGTYQVSFMPFGPQNAQAVTPLPNTEGGYDLFFFIYGPFKVARLEGTTFVDVTAEYENYKNINYVSTINPYVHSFWHEDKYYLVTPDVPIEAIQNAEATDFAQAGHDDNRDLRLGFTLWEFKPGEGFFLSDYYHPEGEVFTYKQGSSDNYSYDIGAVLFDIPVFTPRWHFFEYTKINDDEPPVLVVQTESSGIRVGEYFRQPVDLDLYYSNAFDRANDLETFVFGSLDVMTGFYIEDGKLIPREKPVVDGNITFNSPGFKFEDATGDGNMDMYTIAGGADRSSVHINQDGTLYRIDLLKAYPPISFSIENGPENFGLGIRNLGRAPYLEFLYWSGGATFWPDYVLNQQPSDFGIMRAIKPITEIPLLTAEDLIEKARQCAEEN
ncbi:hypothetical protein, partial [Aliidiomarina sp.]|uniref:hypothetical protein n=1 Tax=Aliidiomarina sp. TaxID=1872439 RepID=UPI003A4D5EF3